MHQSPGNSGNGKVGPAQLQDAVRVIELIVVTGLSISASPAILQGNQMDEAVAVKRIWTTTRQQEVGHG